MEMCLLGRVVACGLMFPIAGAALLAADTGPSTQITQQERDYARQASAPVKAGTDLVDAKELRIRGGLPNVFAKLQSGQAVTIAYFGGSITAHNGWRPMTFKWFQDQFPNAKITMIPASVGGTGSLVGVFRADKDLVAVKPDLVFIEFAVNDGGDARGKPDEVIGAIEGIVRKLWRDKNDTDVCIVYTMGAGELPILSKGKFQVAASVHEKVAERYNIPSIHMGMEVTRLSNEGKLVFTAPATASGKTEDGKIIFSNDAVHPTIPTGHALYADAVMRSMEQMRGMAKPALHELGKPMSGIRWEEAKTIPADGNAVFTGTWDKVTAKDGPACFRFGKRFYEWFPFLYRTSVPGSAVTVKFKGTHIGIKGMTGPDSTMISVKVDDQPAVKQCQFSVYAASYAYIGGPLPAMADGLHTVTWTMLEEKPDKGKILASRARAGVVTDFQAHPEKYKDHTFSVGQIILIGEMVDGGATGK